MNHTSCCVDRDPDRLSLSFFRPPALSAAHLHGEDGDLKRLLVSTPPLPVFKFPDGPFLNGPDETCFLIRLDRSRSMRLSVADGTALWNRPAALVPSRDEHDLDPGIPLAERQRRVLFFSHSCLPLLHKPVRSSWFLTANAGIAAASSDALNLRDCEQYFRAGP